MWEKDNLSFHELLTDLSRGSSGEKASDASWQDVQIQDVDMESVTDSIHTALSGSEEEQVVERLQILEEASNALGQTLQLYAGDSLDQAYSFVAPFVGQTGDYEELVRKMSDSDQTRLDFYLDQADFTSWYGSMEDWTR